MTAIPTQWDRIEGYLLPLLRGEFPGTKITNNKPRQSAPFTCVVIRADLQQKRTPISRYCRIGIQAWNIQADGSANFQAAGDLAAAIAAFVESLPSQANTPFLTAETQSGPSRFDDAASGPEYSYCEVLALVHAA